MGRYYIVIPLALAIGLASSENSKIDVKENRNVKVETKAEDVMSEPSLIIPLHGIIPEHEVNIAKKREINIIATAYTADPRENGDNHGITASGKRISRGMIATPRDIKFGTKIYINGMGEYSVEDRGNPKYIRWIDANTVRIDIFMHDKSEALKFGVQHLTGYIIED